MLVAELHELIRNGENSGVEFKRDDVHPDSLAKEIGALLNLRGGRILLGLEDDGAVSGLTRDRQAAEEWVMNICRHNLQPAIIPYWEVIPWGTDKLVGVITLPGDYPDKPYKFKRGGAWVTFVRVGTTSREATREEEARLYQASGLMRYDTKPVPGAGLEELDLRRLKDYFLQWRRQKSPRPGDLEAWGRLLVNCDLMGILEGKPERAVPTVGAMLLFGRNPNRFLPQAGVSAAAYPSPQKDYATLERAVLRGPLVGRFAKGRKLLENGVVEQVLDFVRRNTRVEAFITPGGQRRDRSADYPLEAVREAVVNALAHRDYSIAVTDIELSLYSDRLEIISPGRLPNTVTVDKMRLGCRATRNELIKEVLRDYAYIEATGLGVPRKIIQGMREHNGSDPDLIEEEDRFIVRLWKERKT